MDAEGSKRFLSRIWGVEELGIDSKSELGFSVFILRFASIVVHCCC